MTQTRLQEHRKINHNIHCAVEVQDREWIPGAPAIVSGKIQNLSEGPLEVQIKPVLYLSSKTSPAQRDKYWAPADLLRDGPLLVDKLPMDKKGDVIAIKPVPIKLAFSKKNESIDFRIDARHVLWEREISSVWPSRDLFAAVEPGSYDLRLVLETKNGDSASANVAILVRAITSLQQKP